MEQLRRWNVSIWGGLLAGSKKFHLTYTLAVTIIIGLIFLFQILHRIWNWQKERIQSKKARRKAAWNEKLEKARAEWMKDAVYIRMVENHELVKAKDEGYQECEQDLLKEWVAVPKVLRHMYMERLCGLAGVDYQENAGGEDEEAPEEGAQRWRDQDGLAVDQNNDQIVAAAPIRYEADFQVELLRRLENMDHALAKLQAGPQEEVLEAVLEEEEEGKEERLQREDELLAQQELKMRRELDGDEEVIFLRLHDLLSLEAFDDGLRDLLLERILNRVRGTGNEPREQRELEWDLHLILSHAAFDPDQHERLCLGIINLVRDFRRYWV